MLRDFKILCNIFKQMLRDKYIFRVVTLISLLSGQLLNAQVPGTKKWEFNISEFVDSSPAIGSDSTIYIGSWDNKLYAINPDGSKKWEFLTGSHVASSPAIGSDGTIYVGSWYSGLYAINPDGSKKWEFKSIGELRGCTTNCISI